MIEGADVHIVVHGLLLGRRDDHQVELGQGIGRLETGGRLDVVKGMPVLGNGRAARRDLGIPAEQLLGAHALLHLEQVGIAVHVVEVLQECKIHLLLGDRVGLALGERCGQIDGQLLVRHCMLEQGFVDGL